MMASGEGVAVLGVLEDSGLDAHPVAHDAWPSTSPQPWMDLSRGWGPRWGWDAAAAPVVSLAILAAADGYQSMTRR
jgi:hypothetical protein